MTAPERSLLRLAQLLVGPAHTPMLASVAQRITRIVVDLQASSPASCELVLRDRSGQALRESGLHIGSEIVIKAERPKSDTAHPIFIGEITSLGASYRGLLGEVLIRAYSRDHRLQRDRRSRAYLNSKDSDIAKEIAQAHKLPLGAIDQSTTTHDHIGQINETDWEFLIRRAREIGFDLRMVDGKFNFQRPPLQPPAPSVTLSWPGQLWSFAPRISASTLPTEVEVRLWDPKGPQGCRGNGAGP
ncbi:MAG: contractile injection system protein, VgrG/Pvc8 family [Actinomycetota bacterium]|nr:contractile injection system protein, VgrG/Pvc8 family [Actinomycetota bacterium]